MWGLVVVGSALVVGGLVAFAPGAAVATGGGATLLAYAAERKRAVWWDIFVFTFAAVLIFDYGFVNVGVVGVPVVDVVLVALLLRARAPFIRPFKWGAVFIAWASVRLLLDYPEFGVLALRDFTLPVEMLWAVVGYWTMVRFGRERWVTVLRWIFLGVLFYSLVCLSDWLVGVSPVVGIDQPVPLLGAPIGTAIAPATFFFTLLKPFGKLSYLFAAAGFGLMLIDQNRALYILIPATFAVLWLLASGSRKRLATAVAVGIVAMALVVSLAPQGRVGVGNAEFYVSHFQTLFGDEGPAAGTIDSRQEWFDQTMNNVAAEPYGWLFGVGLGDDLINKFSTEAGFIRKPHNDFLEVFARYGLVGIVPFMLALWLSFRRVVRGARRTRDPFLWWAVAVAIVLLGNAAVQPLLAFPYGTVPLFSLLGAGLALSHQTSRSAAVGSLSHDRSLACKDGVARRVPRPKKELPASHQGWPRNRVARGKNIQSTGSS